MSVVVMLAFVMPVVVSSAPAQAKGHDGGGTPQLYWFEGQVRDGVTIKGLASIGIFVTYDWPIGGLHQEAAVSNSFGDYVLRPEHAGINTVYTIWANYAAADGAHWCERRQVTFPTGYNSFFLPVNKASYLYTTETYANTAYVQTIKYTQTTSHSETIYAYVGVGPGFGYNKLTSSTVQSGLSSPAGQSLQVRVPYMSTGVCSLYPGSLTKYVVEQAWLYGNPTGPVETGQFKADVMKRPNNAGCQMSLAPGYTWEMTKSFASSHTHQNGVDISVSAIVASQKALQVDYQKTSLTSEEMYFKIVNTDTQTHIFEYYWDGLDLHLWLVR